MTATPAFTVDALLFVDRKEGGLRKRLKRHLFAYSTPQLGDDILFSTRLFNATPHVLGQEPPHVKT